MALAGVPGISIGIIDGNSNTTETYHLGYRDVENKLPPNDHTRYNINSLTKGILSALAAAEVLRSQGADNEIYLPRSEAARTFASLKMTEPFRTSFEYSNWNYELVGQVLERATGRTISDLFEKRFFTPLGMKRTSTSWSESDDNQAKSYGMLPDLSPVEVGRPFRGNDTIMTAVGGVKSTLHDMLIFYKAFMEEVPVHYASLYDSIGSYPFKYCRMLTTSHASLPGPSLREQGYGLGWVRAELPGPLGRMSANVPSGGIIVGRGSPSHLVLYNQGCMPGSSSGVWLMPEVKAGVVVLQNSLGFVDTADFIGQLLLETLLQPPEPNDYVDISRQFNARARGSIGDVKAELEFFHIPGTHARPLPSYEGRFWNELHNFFIDIAVSDTGTLQMKWQGLDSQSHELRHYHYDVFSWLMAPEEMVRRALGSQFYPAEYYLLEFGSDKNGDQVDYLRWSMDGNCTWDSTWESKWEITLEKLEFRKHSEKTTSVIVLGLAVLVLPILTAAILGLVATACFWSLLMSLTIIFLSTALLPTAVIAATIWLTYTTVRWSADLFAKVPVGSENESNQVLMKPEAAANANEAHAKLELNLFKVEEKGDDGRM
ncbi:hypothetical protein INS49_003553 [Diaporthe citri]|uniref:uncharacterized protein n=1 Tax=Diaporthe citri TaxID=83186 RepID=UPI001C80892B|nr:uncharacterized protein INS49_003553 [Diaporthe citri]KAG6355591.1 hypothetical protein INS49_003553 [Diaporthe citri]